jgi:hypothetical protein
MPSAYPDSADHAHKKGATNMNGREGIVGGVERHGLWRYAWALHPDADPPFPTAARSR